MIVQRFMNWIRKTVGASLGGLRRHDVSQHVREPVLVGAASQTGSPDRSSLGLSLSSWLDNGRRLRPRLRITPPLRDGSASTTRPQRHKAQPTVLPASAETPAPAPRTMHTPIAAEPVQPDDAIPGPRPPEVHGDDLTNLERHDAETRRLMLLRHLVRRRVFNEGFAGDDVPSQYRRSLGLDDSPPA